MEKLRNYLIVGAVVFLPFIYRNEIIDPAMMPRFLLLCAVLSLILITTLVRWVKSSELPDLSVMNRAIVPVFLGYLLISAVAMTQAISLSEAIFDLCRTTVGLLIFIVLTLAFHQDGKLRLTICKGLAVACIGLTAIAIAQQFGIGFLSIPGNHIPYATMTNKNLLASALLLMMPFVLYLWYRGGTVWRRVALTASALALYVILISQTRSVWLALAVAALVTGVVVIATGGFSRLGNERSNWRARLIPFVGVVVLALALSTATLVLRRTTDNGTDSFINFSSASIHQRLALWEKSGMMYLDNPILGVGPGNWKVVVPSYGTAGLPSQSGEFFFLRPHNDYLWVLTEAGPVALLLYLSLFLIGLYYGIKLIRTATFESDRALAAAMTFGLIAFLVVSFFSFPRERMVHIVLVMTILSVLTSLYHRNYPTRSEPAMIWMIPGFVLSVAALIVCLVVGSYRYQAETHIQKGIAASTVEDWPRVISEVEQARSFLVALDPATNPLAWYIGLAHLRMGNYDDAMRNFLKAYRDNPYHIQLLNGLATCFEAKGNHLSAIEFYRRAADISPRDETFLNLAAACFNAGQYRKARSYLDRVQVSSNDSEQYKMIEKALMELEG